MNEGNRGYHRKRYQRVWRDVKTRAPMNPRDNDKKNTRKYLSWAERNMDAKIAANDARGRAGKGKYRARYQKWNANRWQARKRGEAYDRWIKQDEGIEGFLDF